MSSTAGNFKEEFKELLLKYDVGVKKSDVYNGWGNLIRVDYCLSYGGEVDYSSTVQEMIDEKVRNSVKSK